MYIEIGALDSTPAEIVSPLSASNFKARYMQPYCPLVGLSTKEVGYVSVWKTVEGTSLVPTVEEKLLTLGTGVVTVIMTVVSDPPAPPPKNIAPNANAEARRSSAETSLDKQHNHECERQCLAVMRFCNCDVGLHWAKMPHGRPVAQRPVGPYNRYVPLTANPQRLGSSSFLGIVLL